VLDELVNAINALVKTLTYFDKCEISKDLVGLEISKDSIILRTNKIGELISGNHQMTFPVTELLELVTQPKVSAKKIHELIDFPIQSLHKFALSEILRTSVLE